MLLVCSPPSWLTSAPSNYFRLSPSSLCNPPRRHLCSPQERSVDTRHAAAPAVHDSFSSLELASFFARLRAAIDVSLYRPSSCFFRVWLRFLLFLFRIRVSVPVSRTACRVRPNFLPSSSPPSAHPTASVYPSHSPRRRNRAQPRVPNAKVLSAKVLSAECTITLPLTTSTLRAECSHSPRRRNRAQPVRWFSALHPLSFSLHPFVFLAPIVAMTSPRRRPQRASPSFLRNRIFKEPQRPEATLPLFKYATSPGRSCRPGRLESRFCDSSSRSWRLLTLCLSRSAKAYMDRPCTVCPFDASLTRRANLERHSWAADTEQSANVDMRILGVGASHRVLLAGKPPDHV